MASVRFPFAIRLRAVLVTGAGRRLRHRDRIGSGKTILKSAIQGFVERLFTIGLGVLALLLVRILGAVGGMMRRPGRTAVLSFDHAALSSMRKAVVHSAAPPLMDPPSL
jgi:hypothetical protein